MGSEELPDLLRYASLDAAGVTRHRLSVLIGDGEYEQIAPASSFGSALSMTRPRR